MTQPSDGPGVLFDGPTAQEIEDVVLWSRRMRGQSTADPSLEPPIMGQRSAWRATPLNVLGTATANISAGAQGTIALQEGLFSGLAEISPQQTLDAWNMTGKRIWGPAGSNDGAVCLCAWFTCKDSGGGFLIVESDSAYKLLGEVSTAATLALDTLTEFDGYFPATTVTANNLFGWDLTSVPLNHKVVADWNESAAQWEATQMECPP